MSSEKRLKVMVVFGTRPEAIKMAPLIFQLKKEKHLFETKVVVTSQHRELLDQVCQVFGIVPDYDLDVMSERQSLVDVTTVILEKLDAVLKKEQPDMVLVHGDTATAFAASLATFYNHIKLGHVEAGLRTWDKLSPFPEEMNRQLTDAMCDVYFASTAKSRANLLQEGRSQDAIFVTGNTVIGTLSLTISDSYHHELFDRLDANKRFILLTMHRRESQGDAMKEVFEAIYEVSAEYEDLEIVFPVHPNPNVQALAKQMLDGVEHIHLISPLDVVDFHNIARRSYFIMTDSGGVQEEAPSLGKPVLVLRKETERPEGVQAGTLRLVGTDKETIKSAMRELLGDRECYNRMARAQNPYGDGCASERITQALAYHFGRAERPLDFASGVSDE